MPSINGIYYILYKLFFTVCVFGIFFFRLLTQVTILCSNSTEISNSIFENLELDCCILHFPANLPKLWKDARTYLRLYILTVLQLCILGMFDMNMIDAFYRHISISSRGVFVATHTLTQSWAVSTWSRFALVWCWKTERMCVMYDWCLLPTHIRGVIVVTHMPTKSWAVSTWSCYALVWCWKNVCDVHWHFVCHVAYV